jgi:hypothetical protein
MKTKSKKQNSFFPLPIPVLRMARWWKEKSFSHDKGGSFNVEHYLKVQNARFE